MTEGGRRTRLVPWHHSTLVPLTRVQAANSAGDALITVALAGTIFFDVPIGEARGRVGLYLFLTMAPFAVVAPVIGPLLDRVRSGRRLAIAVAMIGRAVLAWWMAGSVGGLRLYPLAFGVLVLSKGYGVARAAAVPRLLPEDLTLVEANSRLSAAGIVCAAVAAMLGGVVVLLTDYRWSLRLAAVVFVVAGVLALRLPKAVNSDAEHPAEKATSLALGALRFAPHVRAALLAAVSLKALSGFLTMFLAFAIRPEPNGKLRLAVIVAGATLGSLSGTAIGTRLRRPPELMLGSVLLAVTIVCALVAQIYGVASASLLALTSGTAGALGKLSFDAILQLEVDDTMRGQAFARSETTLQLAWVAGGALGLVPVPERVGLTIAAGALLMAVLATRPGLRRRVANPLDPGA